MLFQSSNHLRHRRQLLADGDVDANDALAFLVDDGVDGEGGFPRLPVADDELTLATTDRDHGIDRLDAGLEWFFHRLAIYDTRRHPLDRVVLFRMDRALAVDRSAQGIDDASDQLLARGNLENRAGALGLVAFLDKGGVAEQHQAHRFFLEVQRQTEHIVRELDELAVHHTLEPVNPGNAVTSGDDGAHFRDVDFGFVIANLLF